MGGALLVSSEAIAHAVQLLPPMYVNLITTRAFPDRALVMAPHTHTHTERIREDSLCSEWCGIGVLSHGGAHEVAIKMRARYGCDVLQA